MDVVRKIEEVERGVGDRPKEKVVIENCGVVVDDDDDDDEGDEIVEDKTMMMDDGWDDNGAPETDATLEEERSAEKSLPR